VTRRQLELTIDISPLLESQWTGIPVFTRRLIQALVARGDVDLDFAINFIRIPRPAVAATVAAGTGTFLREEFIMRAGFDYGPVDPQRPILFPSAKPRGGGMLAREASVVHDLSTLFMPENHQEANVAHHLDNLDRELRTNELTFCISEATQAALTSAMPSTLPSTRLIYQYVDWPEHFALSDANLPPISFGRYAVVIGTIEPRKNLDILLRALSLPEVARLDLAFVVVGKRGWLVDEFMQSFTDEQRQRIQFSGFVSEFVKYRLLRNCEFLVFPSVYEGFGIPALEAMGLSRPVLSARSSSLPEVVGDGGLYFDPFSVSDFAAALAEISQPRMLAELAPKALRQSRAFHPARMAEPVADWIRS
jgi:glycosyltransferase involved in cell wall biosynthesis